MYTILALRKNHELNETGWYFWFEYRGHKVYLDDEIPLSLQEFEDYQDILFEVFSEGEAYFVGNDLIGYTFDKDFE